MESLRSRYRRVVESSWLGCWLVTLACTPAFHERDSEAGGAAGDGGTGAAGRAASSTGGAASGNGGSSTPGGGGAGGGSSGGTGGSTQGGTHAEQGGTGGTAASGGMPLQGGSPAVGGTDALGGTGALGGTDAMGGTGPQGGAPPEGGRGPLVGGAGGVIAVSGRAGAAGGPNLPLGCTSPNVIDDMEDGDQLICASAGRSGDWWTAVGPTTATIDPRTDDDFPAFELGADARAGSKYGMRLAGEGFGRTDDDWASLGFYLAGGDAYSLLGYTGITFYGKANVDVTIQVTFATATTTPEGEGGDCVDKCNDHYALGAELTSSWQEFSIPFASLAQEGWGEKEKDLEHTLFIYFGYVGPNGGPTSFDFLVDDIRLY